MKRLGILLVFALVLGLAMPAVGAEFAFHGDLNNRFTSTLIRPVSLLALATEQSTAAGRRIKDDGQGDFWAGAKYRLVDRGSHQRRRGERRVRH